MKAKDTLYMNDTITQKPEKPGFGMLHHKWFMLICLETLMLKHNIGAVKSRIICRPTLSLIKSIMIKSSAP